MCITANSGLDIGDYVMAGHAFATNTTITTDIGGMTGANKARWQRVWYADVTNSSTAIDLSVEFDMSDGGMAPFTLGATSNYVLLYRTGLTGNWLELTTASSVSGDKVIFNSVAATADGYFTLGTRDFNLSPLPISLLSFTAIMANKGVVLNWTTASEKDNDFFILERSNDGQNFESVADVKAAGYSQQRIDYTFTDKNPYKGISYYQLIQVDTDGGKKTSGIVSVNLENESEEFIVFPNPTTGNFSIKFPASNANEISVSIKDFLGRELFSNLILTKNENDLYQYNSGGELVAGTYIITASFGYRKYSQKLIIK